MKSIKYFFGMLLLVSVFGLVSCKDKNDDKKPNFTADYPEADAVAGKITIFAKFESGLCENGVVALAGSYKLKPDSEKDWSTTPSELLKFVSAGTIGDKDWGAEGWYKVTVDVPNPVKNDKGEIEPAGNILGAKPVHLKDGKFDWDYQIGDKNSVEVKSGDIDIKDGFTGECDIFFMSNSTAAIIFKAWKKDPCVDLPTNSYTFNVTVPEGTPEDAKVTIAGKFGPDGTPLYWNPANEDMVLTKGADGKYSITLNDVEEGTEYKYVLNGTWDNEERAANVDGDDCAPQVGNRATGSSTTINDEVLNWKGITTCISAGDFDYTFILTVPECTPEDAVIRIVGAFGAAGYPNWDENSDDMIMTKGEDGTYTITLEGVPDKTPYKYFINGGWTNGEVIASDRTTGTEETIEDTVVAWEGIEGCIEDVPAGTGTFTVTITSDVEEDAVIIFTGNFAEDAWGDSNREMTLEEDGTYTWTGDYPVNFKCKVIKRIDGEDDVWSSGDDQVFDGENFEFEFSFPE